MSDTRGVKGWVSVDLLKQFACDDAYSPKSLTILKHSCDWFIPVVIHPAAEDPMVRVREVLRAVRNEYTSKWYSADTFGLNDQMSGALLACEDIANLLGISLEVDGEDQEA